MIMKKQLLFLVLSICATLTNAQFLSDTLFIEKTDGSMLIIPKIYIVEQTETSSVITYTLTGGITHELPKADIATIYYKSLRDKPKLERFWFNNKHNDQLYTDVIGEIDESNGKVTASVGCIGKRLTPSFKVPDGTCVYADGMQQESMKSRLRFDETVHYTVGYPNQYIYSVDTKNNDTIWTQTQVNLTANMLSTNAPSNYGEDLGNMLDGSASTFFHSTWGSGTYTPLYYYNGAYYGDGVSEWPYIQVALSEPLYNLQFSYMTRANNNYAPLGLILQGSTNGSTWTDIRTFTANDSEDPLPTTPATTYTSPIISITQTYNYLRLQLTEAQNKNYLVFPEFSLYKATFSVPNSGTYYRVPFDLATSGNFGLLFNRQPYVQLELPEEACGVSFSYTTLYKGDVNRDGEVDEADIAAMADLLLYKRDGHDMPTVDMNEDNELSIADLTALANAVANGTKELYAPTQLTLRASTDGTTWSHLRSYTTTSSLYYPLPTRANVTYPGQIVSFDVGKYKYVQLIQESTSDRYKLKLCDLRFCYTAHQCETSFQPYGTGYDVEVDFLTDHPTSSYNVPRIDITFGDGESWNSSMWIGRYGKEFYEDATIKIDGAGVFPDMAETAVQIRGRGNTSWSGSYSSKNPYRLKFASKVKPFGMTKGKSWVLLSNKQTGSMTSNALAMKIADMVESRGCNHVIPVELYINGYYRGSYNFTENPGFSNNSIDLDYETNAVMLELDSYYDEYKRFRDTSYNLPVNVKEPDFEDDINAGLLTEDEVEERFSLIQQNFNAFTQDTKYGITSRLDVDAFVRAMLVNDLVRNEEYKHPKSWKLYNPDITNSDSLWTFGPVWDFDWSYGYDGPSQYFVYSADTDLFYNTSGVGVNFFRDLLRNSDTVKRAYYLLWKEFMESGKLDELIEYCDDYFEYARPSFEHNYSKWSDGNNYQTHTSNAKTWLRKRANYIYNNLQRYDE